MDTYNIQETTDEVKSMLSDFPLVGIASRERFENRSVKSLEDKHPSKLIQNFQSVIVMAEGVHKKDKDKAVDNSFDFHLSKLTSPLEVCAYLNTLGYKSHIAHKSDLDVSLVDMSVQAGIGELAPVNGLVVKGYGLTPVMQAIITEAPLTPDDLAAEKSHCIQCNLCMRVCPIRDEWYAAGDMSKCACNKCVAKCPV